MEHSLILFRKGDCIVKQTFIYSFIILFHIHVLSFSKIKKIKNKNEQKKNCFRTVVEFEVLASVSTFLKC